MQSFHGSRALLLLALLIALSACTAEQPVVASAAPCDFKVTPHNSPKFATYADDLRIPYKQDKLVDFMWADQSECYARQFAPINIYRVPYTENSGVFNNLREAPAKSIESWRSFEVASGNMLMGLTTFRFEPGANERIIESTILLRTDATKWHMWHEFSHFIIGTDRASSHDHSLQIADAMTLETLKKSIDTFSTDEDAYSQKLQTYFNANHEYLMKRYLDEIVIEASLIFLVQQQGSTPGASEREMQSSLHLIQFFQTQLNQHIDVTLHSINELKKNPLSKAQLDLLDMYQQRLHHQRDTVERIVSESSTLSLDVLFPF